IGGGASLPGEGEASASDDSAGEGDLRDVYCRCSGLTVPSTHRCVRSSLYAPTMSAVGFGLERSPGRAGHGFTPRGRKRLLVLFISVDRWVPPLHPSSSSLTVHQP